MTLAQMERELYQAAASPDTKIVLRRMFKEHGMAKLSERKIIIDPHFGGLVDTLVHELIHLVYRKQFEWWGELEECLVEALELKVVNYIYKNRGRVSRWRKIAETLSL